MQGDPVAVGSRRRAERLGMEWLLISGRGASDEAARDVLEERWRAHHRHRGAASRASRPPAGELGPTDIDATHRLSGWRRQSLGHQQFVSVPHAPAQAAAARRLRYRQRVRWGLHSDALPRSGRGCLVRSRDGGRRAGVRVACRGRDEAGPSSPQRPQQVRPDLQARTTGTVSPATRVGERVGWRSCLSTSNGFGMADSAARPARPRMAAGWQWGPQPQRVRGFFGAPRTAN